MTDKGRRLFYVNQPVIVSEADFNESCKTQESSIVLGCYIQNQGIYIFNVTDERLTGVKEVTAAHEMLHGAYDRLSPKERKRIDQLTAEAYTGLKNERIRKNVENYRSQDPAVVPNELHSILPTEVRTLSPELEQYYKQYFSDRQKIVDYSERYESEFTNRQQRVAEIDKQLASLKQTIENERATLDAAYNNLIAEKRRLDSLLSSGDVSAYNQAVPGFNADIASYNDSVRTVDNDIAEYNSLVKQRNAIAVEVQNLAEAIDSRPQSF
jgi:chromosome segregation ATPase